MMKVVFIHYHLKPGGVTTVLKHQIEAVQTFGEALVITGEAPPEPLSAPFRIIPSLSYDTVRVDADSPKQIAAAVSSAIHETWADGCDLIHIHNPTLNKNKDLLHVIELLQKENASLFLQIHDFAEEGRPHVYYQQAYPHHCHYGVINTRDYGFLIDSGLQEKGLHYIPNAVSTEPAEVGDSSLEDCILYPVRAIRRKNLGEVLFLSMLLPAELPLRVTLPPNSPADFTPYRYWQKQVRHYGLNVEFESGIKHEFQQLYRSARFILTTSIMEGFGFSFLEPWLSGKMVWGRLLPAICAGFIKEGIDLSHLYLHIMVPTEWAGRSDLCLSIRQTMESSYAAYGLCVPSSKIEKALTHIEQQDCIDFGTLSEFFQTRILDSMNNNPQAIDRLVKLNPFLADIGVKPVKQQIISQNAAIIGSRVSKGRYTQRLNHLYQKMVQTKVRHRIDKHRLLLLFLETDLHNLLKWGQFDGQGADQ